MITNEFDELFGDMTNRDPEPTPDEDVLKDWEGDPIYGQPAKPTEYDDVEFDDLF